MRARIKAVMVTGTASWARAKEGEDTGLAEAMAMVGQAVVEVQERVKKVEGWAVGVVGAVGAAEGVHLSQPAAEDA